MSAHHAITNPQYPQKLLTILQHSADYLFDLDLKTHAVKDDSQLLGHTDALPKIDCIPGGLLQLGMIKASTCPTIYKMLETLQRDVDFVSSHIEFRMHAEDDFQWYSICFYTYIDEQGKLHAAGYLKSIHAEIMHRKNLELLAEFDELTQIHNRRSGKQMVEELLALPRSGEDDHTMFIFDLDDFKNINDVYGHYTGDTVLCGFAKLLTQIFRRTDIIYRLGGDEFAVFAPNAGSDYFLRRICHDVLQLSAHLDGIDFPVSVSIGAAISSNPSVTYDDYYKAADQALYSVKKERKGDFAFTYF